MKTSKLLFMSVMLFGALTLASCGSSGEKAKTEEAKVECTHDHEKDHECDEAKKDSCTHEKTGDHECAKELEKADNTK